MECSEGTEPDLVESAVFPWEIGAESAGSILEQAEPSVDE